MWAHIGADVSLLKGRTYNIYWRHAKKCTGKKKKNWKQKQQEKISVFRLLAIADCELRSLLNSFITVLTWSFNTLFFKRIYGPRISLEWDWKYWILDTKSAAPCWYHDCSLHSKKHHVPPNIYIYLHRSSSWQLLTVAQKFALEQNVRAQASKYFVCTFHQVDKSTWIKMCFLQCGQSIYMSSNLNPETFMWNYHNILLVYHYYNIIYMLLSW